MSEQFMVRVTDRNGQTWDDGPYAKDRAMRGQRAYRQHGSDAQLLPYERKRVFTANITCSEAEAERLKKLLDDAIVRGAGSWGHHPEPFS
jgi:hypothetical protein